MTLSLGNTLKIWAEVITIFSAIKNPVADIEEATPLILLTIKPKLLNGCLLNMLDGAFCLLS